MVAGPSEALVLADDSAPAEWVAADLLSQAEHAGDETAVLVTPSEKLAKAVAQALKAQLKALPRRVVAESSLKKHSLVVVCGGLDLAVEVAELVASEHLQLMVRDAERVLPKIKAAGAIFVGPFTPVSLGDFLAGPSHVLPTGGTARFSNGLSVDDFCTKSSIIGYSRQALAAALPDLEQIGGAEGLQAHVQQVRLHPPGPRAFLSMAAELRPELAALKAYQAEPPLGDAALDANENAFAPPEGLPGPGGSGGAGRHPPEPRYPDPSAAALRGRLAGLQGLPGDGFCSFGNGSDELIRPAADGLRRGGGAVPGPPADVFHVQALRLGPGLEGARGGPGPGLAADRGLCGRGQAPETSPDLPGQPQQPHRQRL